MSVRLPVAPETAAKFRFDGKPCRYPGITISAPLRLSRATCAAFDSLLTGLRQDCMVSAFSFLPRCAWHVTLVRGVNDARRTPEVWLAGLPLNATMLEISRAIAPRAKRVFKPQQLRLHATDLAMTEAGDLRLSFAPENSMVDHVARYRYRMARSLGHRAREDLRPLHMTLAYRTSEIDTDQAEAFRMRLVDLWAKHGKVFGPLSFTAPHLRVYRDMWDFGCRRSSPKS